ncbi:hypothetical protein ABPG74_003504 [Tetrahymena malaccensis]
MTIFSLFLSFDNLIEWPQKLYIGQLIISLQISKNNKQRKERTNKKTNQQIQKLNNQQSILITNYTYYKNFEKQIVKEKINILNLNPYPLTNTAKNTYQLIIKISSLLQIWIPSTFCSYFKISLTSSLFCNKFHILKKAHSLTPYSLGDIINSLIYSKLSLEIIIQSKHSNQTKPSIHPFTSFLFQKCQQQIKSRTLTYSIMKLLFKFSYQLIDYQSIVFV